MIEIDMRISHNMRKTSRDQITNMSEHMAKESIAADIEWYAKPHITGSLIQLTMEMPFRFTFAAPL
jgi:hypothetical protein